MAPGERLNWLNISAYSVRAPLASMRPRSRAMTSGENAVMEKVLGPIIAGLLRPARRKLMQGDHRSFVDLYSEDVPAPSSHCYTVAVGS
mmetsp:Transcript_837/g.1216  ORF Transcript_837/g.1216 Transcript_837/m.1216 type:complete len:89 (-) Transcript_837:169-435(-)